MTPASSVLSISATPRSVAEARQWVVDVCHSIGRDDVVECAQLAVSELVTNAILHGGPPLSVRLGGTPLHPRIEVADGSRVLPAPRDLDGGGGDGDEEHLLTTVGRGLRLVSQCSETWGTQVGADGKVVWFVPTTEPGGTSLREPQVTYEEGPGEAVPSAGDPVPVRIRGLAVGRYRDLCRHLTELRRELRLLALANEADYPVAGQLSELFLLFDRELASTVGLEVAGRGLQECIDVDVVVDRGVLSTVAQLLDVLQLADDFARTERLLALTPTTTQQSFTRWYLGEFVSQGRGHDSTAWDEPSGPVPSPPRPRTAS